MSIADKHISLSIVLRDQQILLLAERAMYWPARRLLVIADIHFGKAASFRALGVPVPAGTTADNLNRLNGLLEKYLVEEILFLGDFMHARAGQAPTMQSLLHWRRHHASLRMTLVRGNHDRHAGDPDPALDILCVDEPYRTAPFLFAHHPALDASGCVVAGHVHPVCRLHASGRRGDSVRLPCFAWNEDHLLLPSFGAFTGGHLLKQMAGTQLAVCADAAIFLLPSLLPVDRR